MSASAPTDNSHATGSAMGEVIVVRRSTTVSGQPLITPPSVQLGQVQRMESPGATTTTTKPGQAL